MAGINDPEFVVCCFCGQQLKEQEAVVLAAYFGDGHEETQGFYCHHFCFETRLRSEIPLHPALRRGTLANEIKK